MSHRQILNKTALPVTVIQLLCSQAWDAAESLGECPSSPAAPSASSWACRASRARGGDPGLRWWGAGGPGRLLQRSEEPTRICPVVKSVRARRSVGFCFPSSVMAGFAAVSFQPSAVATPLQGCSLVARKEQQSCFLPNVGSVRRISSFTTHLFQMPPHPLHKHTHTYTQYHTKHETLWWCTVLHRHSSHSCGLKVQVEKCTQVKYYFHS